MKIFSVLTVLVASTGALRPPFDAIHEARRRMMQRKLTLSGKITGFSLIDAETSTKLADLVNGTVFDLSAMTNPTFNINASYTGSDIASVKFGHNGNPNVHTENFAWYSFCGNSGPNFFDCSSLGIGNHTVTATPYSDRFAGGDAGASYTVSFSIVSGKTAAATPVMAPVPTPISVPAASKPLIPVPIGVSTPLPTSSFTDDNVGYEPELLVWKLSSWKVNVTSGPSTVQVLAVFEDDGVGYSDISVSAYAPEDASSMVPYLPDAMNGAQGSCTKPTPMEGGLGCNISLTFPQYYVEGRYRLNAYVYSRNYENFYSIDSEQLKERGLPHFIKVASANPDKTPPKLLDFDVISPTTVNATSDRSTTLDLQFVVQDDLSGVGFGSVQALDTDGSAVAMGYFTTFEFPYNNSKAGQPNTFNVSVAFGKFNRPGNYSLQLSVSDQVGNTADFYNLSTITVVNSAYDGSPPQLLDFVALSPTSVNVTSAPAIIEMQVLVLDNTSGVEGVSISAESFEINSFLETSYYLETSMAGQAVLVNVSMMIPRYTRAGEYKLSLRLYDRRGNGVLYHPDQLANRTYPYLINVVNSLEDFAPPKLLNLVALTPTKVNASSPLKTVTLQVVAQDNVSGVADLYINAYDGGSGALYEVGTRNYNRLPVIGSPVSFNITLEVKQSSKPGKYDLDLSLYDVANNYAFVSAGQLKKLNLPYSIEVINPDYDGAPPVLEDLVMLSSATVNVTLAPAILEVQVVVRDEISGFKQGTVELWSYRAEPLNELSESSVTVTYDPDTGEATDMSSSMSSVDESTFYFEYNISHATFVADKKVGNETYVYNVSLPIPQYVTPGKYAIQLYLNDFADNGVLIGKSEMTTRSLPYEIQIDNLIVDKEPPVLVNFTALTPLVVNVTSGPAVIAFQATVQDALSGVYFGYIGMNGPGSNYRYYNYSETMLDVPVAGKPVVFNATFTLDAEFFKGGLYKGTYNIDVGVSDHVGRYISLMSKDLIALGFPGTFVVA